MKRLLSTDNSDTTAFILRITLGFVMFPHGAQKLLGWFGGFGYTNTIGYFTGTVGVPYIIGLLVILAESIGAVMLIAGFISRFAAFSIMAAMTGAMFMHTANGFFMNWFGKQAGEGIEYFILVIAIALSVMISGGGRWSMDGLLSKRQSAGHVV